MTKVMNENSMKEQRNSLNKVYYIVDVVIEQGVGFLIVMLYNKNKTEFKDKNIG